MFKDEPKSNFASTLDGTKSLIDGMFFLQDQLRVPRLVVEDQLYRVKRIENGEVETW